MKRPRGLIAISNPVQKRKLLEGGCTRYIAVVGHFGDLSTSHVIVCMNWQAGHGEEEEEGFWTGSCSRDEKTAAEIHHYPFTSPSRLLPC